MDTEVPVRRGQYLARGGDSDDDNQPAANEQPASGEPRSNRRPIRPAPVTRKPVAERLFWA